MTTGDLTTAALPGIAYQPEQWHDLFAASAGAAATLGGLVFVAVSLNLDHVLNKPSLPPLAARALAVLIGLLLMSLLCLAPAQSAASLGADISVLGAAVLVLVLVMASARRTRLRVSRWSWTVQDFVLAAVSTVPTVAAGVTLMLGAGGGLRWAVLELICGFSVAVYDAWVLLIEIRR